MKIKITNEDIKKGEPGNCHTCAISQSLKRIFKVDEVCTEVDGGDITLTVNEKKYEVVYEDQDDVLMFIERFDNHLEYEYLGVEDCKPPKPFTFEIEEEK